MANASAVLVAGEDRDSSRGLVSLLAQNGFEARAAHDASTALEIARTWKPASAVLEIAVPHASGFSLAYQLRETFGREIKLIAYTGWTPVGQQSKALAAGFDHVLSKPCDPQDLLVVLGADFRQTVLRSMTVNAEQMRLQMELANTLINHAQLTADPRFRRDICEFIRQRIETLGDRIVGQTIPGGERDRLEQQLLTLRDRLSRFQP